MPSIADIDPNFKLPQDIPQNIIFHDVFEKPFTLYGLAENEKGIFSRLPVNMLPDCNEGVQILAYNTAGACVRFSCDADHMAVLWQLADAMNMPHFAASGQSGLELFEETDHGTVEIKNVIPAMNDGCGCLLNQSSYFPLPKGMRHYVLYFPLYNGMKKLLLGFAPDVRIAEGRKPKVEKPILFYGSSITQGGCASKSGSCYSTILCRELDAPQINLGFSGSGRGEINMAEYIAGQPMSIFVMDYDHNAPTAEHLKATHEPFFRCIREKQPDLPVVMLSMPSPEYEFTPELCALRRDIIMQTYLNARNSGDQHVYFVDGAVLFGTEDRELCTVDHTHPTDLGFYRMAKALKPLLQNILTHQI